MEAIAFIEKEINTLKTKKAKARKKSGYDERIAAFENVLKILEYQISIDNFFKRIEPGVLSLIEKMEEDAENKAIKITTPAEYIKNMTGVLADGELIEAIESQIRSNNETFNKNYICITLDGIRTTPTQDQLLKNTYCQNVETGIVNEAWSSIKINYIENSFTKFYHTNILLFF